MTNFSDVSFGKFPLTTTNARINRKLTLLHHPGDTLEVSVWLRLTSEAGSVSNSVPQNCGLSRIESKKTQWENQTGNSSPSSGLRQKSNSDLSSCTSLFPIWFFSPFLLVDALLVPPPQNNKSPSTIWPLQSHMRVCPRMCPSDKCVSA